MSKGEEDVFLYPLYIFYEEEMSEQTAASLYSVIDVAGKASTKQIMEHPEVSVAANVKEASRHQSAIEKEFQGERRSTH